MVKTMIAGIHLCFWRYVPVSPAVVCITMDECIHPWQWGWWWCIFDMGKSGLE